MVMYEWVSNTCEYLNLKKHFIVTEIWPLILLKIFTLTLSTLTLSFLMLSEATSEIFVNVFMRDVIKYSGNAVAKGHPGEEANENIIACVSSSTSSLDLALCRFWLFAKVKLPLKIKHFEWIPATEAGMALHLKT